MKITINQRDLIKAINIAQKAISNRTTMQILSGILFEAIGDKIILKSTDFDLAIETKVLCQVDEEGSLVINSNLFGNIVRKLPDAPVNIQTEGNNIEIRCENLNYKLTGMDRSEYPQLPEIKSEESIDISSKDMNKIINHTLFSASVDDTRPVFMGVLFEIKNDKLVCVSLDGYRLSRVRIGLKEGENVDDFSVIIPSRTLNELTKIVGEDENIRISTIPGHILFEFGDTKFYSRLLEGKFVDYDQILNEESSSYVTINRSDLVHALDRISILASDDKARLVKLSISNNNIELKSNTEIGDGYEKVACVQNGEDLKIAFNNRYLLDGIRSVQTENILVKYKGSVNPCTIHPVDSDFDYVHLVLPVKLKSEVF